VEALATEGGTLPVSALLQPHRHGVGGGACLSATFRDVSGRKSVEIELARQARRDPLTGLPNRLAIMELLAEAQQAGGVAGSLAVLFVDLDNLKVSTTVWGTAPATSCWSRWPDASSPAFARTMCSAASAVMSSS
jgi:hypothetical protein